ncbi:MAG: alkaline phosphatase family protein [Anaerolineales bacterium]
MRLLFIFLDGIGLGPDDLLTNPLARAAMPRLESLLEGRRLTAPAAPYVNGRAALLALDPRLGVAGLPQSATGQAVLLTGRNVPAEIGEHYGPKPDERIAAILREDNLFKRLSAARKTAALLNAYPPRYFHGVNSGKRLYSSIPLAVTSAGLPLFTETEFFTGQALSADFTGQGWRDMLGYPQAPVLTARDAGRKLAELASRYDFSFFEYWASDYAGHKQDMDDALRQMSVFDAVLGGLLDSLPDDLLVLVTSDHGNMEDLSTRRHTLADVPCLLIGASHRDFARPLRTLQDVTPAILNALL